MHMRQHNAHATSPHLCKSATRHQCQGLGAPGVSSPERHIITLRQGLIVNMLVKRTPFTPLEIQAFEGWVRQANACRPSGAGTNVIMLGS